MREEYIPVVRPSVGRYYDKLNALYDGLRQTLPAMGARAEQGESLDALAAETWEFFRSIR